MCTSPSCRIDDDGIARVDPLDDAARLADGGDAERTGDDGHMALPAAILDHQAAQLRPVVVEQLRRPHAPRHQDGVVRHVLAWRLAELPRRQDAQQAVGQIVEVAQPLAPERIGLTQHARPRLVLHALDRGLGRQAALHRLSSRRSQPRSLANMR